METLTPETNLESLRVTQELTPFDNLVQQAADAVDVCRASVRKAAMDYVAAGRALRAVKDELHVRPGAVQIRDDSGHFTEKDNVSFSVEKGWQTLCQCRIGISYKTADRYIEDAQAYELLVHDAEQLPRAAAYLDAVQSGEMRAGAALIALQQYKAIPEAAPVIDASRWDGLEASCKTQADLVRFREMETAALSGDDLAANQLEQAAKGNIPLARAYAGWQGGKATKDKTRHDPDYARLAVRSATTFLNAWKRYNDMPLEVRSETSKAIVAVMTAEDIPDEVGREIFRRLADRYGAPANKR